MSPERKAESARRALILGCGYTGRRLGRELLAEGLEVVGTTRSGDRARELEGEGISPLLLRVEGPSDLEALRREEPEVCFHLIPPPAGNDGDAGDGASPLHPGEVPATALRILAAAGLRCFVYVSSTSVYGDRGGAWVAEEDAPAPDSDVGRARLAAEAAVLEAGRNAGVETRIGRPAGIYGPGRAGVEAIREGRYHVVEGMDGWSNRIHVDDLARALVALWRRGRDGRVYNLCDGRPHRSSEYAAIVSDLAGVAVPRLGPEEARRRYGPRRLARKAASKRVSNRRLREEIGFRFRHPDLREGLAASV